MHIPFDPPRVLCQFFSFHAERPGRIERDRFEIVSDVLLSCATSAFGRRISAFPGAPEIDSVIKRIANAILAITVLFLATAVGLVLRGFSATHAQKYTCSRPYFKLTPDSIASTSQLASAPVPCSQSAIAAAAAAPVFDERRHLEEQRTKWMRETQGSEEFYANNIYFYLRFGEFTNLQKMTTMPAHGAPPLLLEEIKRTLSRYSDDFLTTFAKELADSDFPVAAAATTSVEAQLIENWLARARELYRTTTRDPYVGYIIHILEAYINQAQTGFSISKKALQLALQNLHQLARDNPHSLTDPTLAYFKEELFDKYYSATGDISEIIRSFLADINVGLAEFLSTE